MVAHRRHYVDGSERSLKTERYAEAGRGRAGAAQQGREAHTPTRTGEQDNGAIREAPSRGSPWKTRLDAKSYDEATKCKPEVGPGETQPRRRLRTVVEYAEGQPPGGCERTPA